MSERKIDFRCWYCNRRYVVLAERVGDRITCSCNRLLRVPKRNGGNSRVKTIVDWIVEAVVYGGGGALLGFGLSLLILSRMLFVRNGWTVIAGCTLIGFLIGLLGGETGINWIGQMIRDRENS